MFYCILSLSFFRSFPTASYRRSGFILSFSSICFKDFYTVIIMFFNNTPMQWLHFHNFVSFSLSFFHSAGPGMLGEITFSFHPSHWNSDPHGREQETSSTEKAPYLFACSNHTREWAEEKKRMFLFLCCFFFRYTIQWRRGMGWSERANKEEEKNTSLERVARAAMR